MALTDNTQKIQNLLDAINSLPDAGGTVLPELTNPGTASDLVEGKQLIGADGKTVTGTVNEITSGQAFYRSEASSSVDASNDLMLMSYTMDSDNLLRNGITILLSTTASELGDAETGDVVAGKTFTSANGKKLTGTHTCSGSDPVVQPLTVTPTENTQTFNPSGFDGYAPVTVNPIPSSYVQPSGTKTITENDTYDVTSLASVLVSVASGGGGELPSGISALECGSFTPAADQTSQYNINHSLGVAPDFAWVYMDGDVTTADIPKGLISQLLLRKNVTGSTTYGVMILSSYANSGGTGWAANVSGPGTSYVNLYLDTGTFGVLAATARVLMAGITYRYIVGVFE